MSRMFKLGADGTLTVSSRLPPSLNKKGWSCKIEDCLPSVKPDLWQQGREILATARSASREW